MNALPVVRLSPPGPAHEFIVDECTRDARRVEVERRAGRQEEIERRAGRGEEIERRAGRREEIE